MKEYCLLILLIIPLFIYGQEFTITDQFVDQNNTPLEFTEVYFFSQNSTLVKTDFTDQQGKISTEFLQGIYKLQIKQLDEVLYSKEINLTESIDLGIIQIKSATEIEGVLVEGKKKLIERKVDRLVFNVENSISASGGDALDALRVTPGIRVKEDAISMIGKSDMKVMIDDKLVQVSGDDLINLLRSISADNIKSIEVITAPPAQYEAEGNSGIINIKLKQPKFNQWNASLRSTYTQEVLPKGSYGLTLNIKRKNYPYIPE